MFRRTFTLAVSAILGFSSLSAGKTNSPDMVVEVFRHGARGPNKDTFDNTWDSSDYGSLTATGERMQYLLGAALAEKYPEIFKQPFDPKKFFIRTSQISRCVKSLKSQLNGAFGGVESALPEGIPEGLAVPAFDNDIISVLLQNLHESNDLPEGFDLLDITSVPVDDDIVLETPSTCPALYADAVTNLKSDDSFNLWVETLAPTKDALKKLGITVKNPLSMGQLGDTLYCDYVQGKTLPANIVFESKIWKDVTFAAYYYAIVSSFTSHKQKQLLSVPLFEEIFRHLDAKANGTTPVEFVFLSTHDSTLMTILASLDIVTKECLMENYVSDNKGQGIPHPSCVFPPFAANILFEFYNNDGNPYVVFKYNDQAIALCGDSLECPYEDFKVLVKQATNGYTVEDYKNICMNGLLNSAKDLTKAVENEFDPKALLGSLADLLHHKK